MAEEKEKEKEKNAKDTEALAKRLDSFLEGENLGKYASSLVKKGYTLETIQLVKMEDLGREFSKAQMPIPDKRVIVTCFAGPSQIAYGKHSLPLKTPPLPSFSLP